MDLHTVVVNYETEKDLPYTSALSLSLSTSQCSYLRSSVKVPSFLDFGSLCFSLLLMLEGFVSDTGFLSYELTFADFFLSLGEYLRTP